MCRLMNITYITVRRITVRKKILSSILSQRVCLYLLVEKPRVRSDNRRYDRNARLLAE